VIGLVDEKLAEFPCALSGAPVADASKNHTAVDSDPSASITKAGTLGFMVAAVVHPDGNPTVHTPEPNVVVDPIVMSTWTIPSFPNLRNLPASVPFPITGLVPAVHDGVYVSHVPPK
jgi:hypothetical protein